MLAICCIALLAMLTAPFKPCSALERRLWMPRVMLLSCCTSDCAALITAMRADCESDEVDSACTDVGQRIEGAFQRSGRSRRAVDGLQLIEHFGPEAGIGGTGDLGAKLPLQIDVELAIDAGDAHARAELAGRDGDLVRGLLDVARRFRVGDVPRNQAERDLVRAQPRHRGGESLAQTHDKLAISVRGRVAVREWRIANGE